VFISVVALTDNLRSFLILKDGALLATLEIIRSKIVRPMHWK